MKKTLVPLAVLAVVALAGSAGYYYWTQYSPGVSSAEARLEARMQPIAPPFAAQVAEVMVAAGDVVEQDQPLYRLDSEPLQAQLAESEELLARLGDALPPEYTDQPNQTAQAGPTGLNTEDMQHLLAMARNRETEARTAVETLSDAKARTAFALATLRARSERDATALAAAADADAQAALAVARGKEQFEQLSSARAALEAAARDQARQDSALKGRATLYAAQREGIALLQEAIAAATVRAPAPGLVSRLNLQAGAPAVPGENLIVFMPFSPDNVWVAAFFLPDQEQALRPGQSCRVHFEDISVTVEGQVESVLPKSIPPHIGKERIPVRVSLAGLDPDAMRGFTPGLAATVTLLP